MAFFAMQVRTGQEIKAKQMIKYLIENSSKKETNLVKSICAMETYTEYVSNDKRERPEVSDISNKDVFTSLMKDTLQEGLSNLKKQYEGIKDYIDKDTIKVKNVLKSNIKKVTDLIEAIKAKTKKLKAMLPGYILIELKMNSDYLPDELWHLIKACPLVVSIPSKYNIPAEEMYAFFKATNVEPEIEICFEKVKTSKEITKDQKNAIHRANTAEDMKEKKAYIKEADNMDKCVIENVNEIKKRSTMIERVKAFIKNEKEAVVMPVSLFEKLYPVSDHVLPTLSIDDFLDRLKQLIQKKDTVALE